MISPITGKFRKQVYFNIFMGLGIGYVAGEIWWRQHHLPQMARRDAYYAKLEANKD